MKLVILYEEIAEYFTSCISHLIINNKVQVMIIKSAANKEAPFEFSAIDATIIDRINFNENELLILINNFSPDAIFCGGWSYKPYLKVCKYYKNKIPVWVGFDNQWSNSLKQKAVAIIGRYWIKQYFNLTFVPGNKQQQFAFKLGFKEDEIYTNAYCCNYDYFSLLSQEKMNNKLTHPKRFLYVGRYVNHKGINDLWTAFIQLIDEGKTDWELWCVGTGAEWENRIQHPQIRHFGFKQPKELREIILQTDVFVLPSHFEPWGVVIHEMAAAGFPMISSNKVGANEAFIRENENGFIYNSGSVEELKNCMNKMMNFSNENLNKMSEVSIKLAATITPEIWSKQVMKMMLFKIK